MSFAGSWLSSCPRSYAKGLWGDQSASPTCDFRICLGWFGAMCATNKAFRHVFVGAMDTSACISPARSLGKKHTPKCKEVLDHPTNHPPNNHPTTPQQPPNNHPTITQQPPNNHPTTPHQAHNHPTPHNHPTTPQQPHNQQTNTTCTMGFVVRESISRRWAARCRPSRGSWGQAWRFGVAWSSLRR